MKYVEPYFKISICKFHTVELVVLTCLRKEVHVKGYYVNNNTVRDKTINGGLKV